MSKGKPFPPEFRAEAVRLHRVSGRPLPATAAEIGVSVNALRRWVRQSKIDQGKAVGLTSEEREELQRLKRENKLLREENRNRGQKPEKPGTTTIFVLKRMAKPAGCPHF